MQKILFVLLAIIYATSGIAQESTVIKPADPENHGFSAERLLRIDKFLEENIRANKMNGAVAMIIKDGNIVYHKSFGYDNIEKKTPMPKDGIFRIASQTKAITSVGVMLLYEEGKFLLDDPVSKYIPEFSKPVVIEKFNLADSTYTTVPAKREVTIRDLLTHTSGIGYAQIGSAEANALYAKAGVVGGIGVGRILLADKMKALGKLPLFHQPGEKFTYGLNTDVLGYLIEVVSGKNLDQFFRDRIFTPLGMNDTYFYLPENKQNRLVSLYSEDKGSLKLMKPEIEIDSEKFSRDYPNTKGTYYSGGGGLSSTIKDYAIFLQMLLNGGSYNGKQLLGKHTVRMMTMNQIGDKEIGNGSKFGLGFGIATEKTSAIFPAPEGSYQWGGMFATSYWVDPSEKIIGLVYRNIWPTSFWQLEPTFKVLTYQALKN